MTAAAVACCRCDGRCENVVQQSLCLDVTHAKSDECRCGVGAHCPPMLNNCGGLPKGGALCYDMKSVAIFLFVPCELLMVRL